MIPGILISILALAGWAAWWSRLRWRQRLFELEQAFAAERQGREAAEAEVRQRRELLLGLRDDLRTPLLGVVSHVELLFESGLNLVQLEELGKVDRAARSLQEVVDNLLDLSQGEVGSLELRPQPFAVRELLSDTLNPLAEHARRRGIELTYHIQPRVPDGLIGDASRLRQVLANLVEDALRATEAGEVVVRVSVASRTEFQIEMAIAVADTRAVGSAEDERAALHGLQLAVARQLVSLLGGELAMESSPGGGHTARFQVKMGLSREYDTSTRRTQLGLIPDLPVLLVDSPSRSRAILEEMLAQWQTVPTCAATSDEAFTALDRARGHGTPFGLVLLDADLPGEDGFLLCERIKHHQIHAATPVLILTGEDHPEQAARAVAVGAAGHLLKPVKSSRLARAIVTAVLGKGRYQQMRRDMGAAELYVRSLIPPPTLAPLKIDWRYVPAADLAGDSLGYHWIDARHCAFYLLDVTGHGLDSALLSVSVLNMLRSMSLPDTDFRKPDQVLANLNDKFPMEAHGNKCFSIWYGVWDETERTLTWAGGGHPPALLLEAGGASPIPLGSTGPLLGMLPSMEFSLERRAVATASRLWIYSDGAFEIERPDGTQWTWEEFVTFLGGADHEELAEGSRLDRLWQHVRGMRGKDSLDDDFTVLEVEF